MNKKLKKIWKNRIKKWGSIRYLTDNKPLNKKLNYLSLVIETLFILYAINALYGCPCSYRTCGIIHYQPDGETKDWEAIDLDCDYTQDYLAKEKAYLSGELDYPGTINNTNMFNLSEQLTYNLEYGL